MAAGPVALLLLACAVLPAAGSGPLAPDLDYLTFPQFKALLRWESYASAGCAVQGGCADECLKGGLEVYDKPKGDTTGSSIYLLSKLENPPNSACRCPPAFGKIVDNVTGSGGTNQKTAVSFTGFYSGETLTLTVDGAGILVNWAGCAHVYAVEESFDRDGDHIPDFLGLGVKDTIPPMVGTILSNAISATVAATIFTNVLTAVVEKILQLLSMKDVQSLAQGIDPEVVGITGGALVPLIQQAAYLGIIGQIGGQGQVPAVVSRMSEGLAWTNFHLRSLLNFNTSDSAPAVQKRRNLVASRRRHMRRMGFRLSAANITDVNKCAKVEKSITELNSTVASVAIAVGSAVATRTIEHVKGILELPEEDLIAQGRMTLMQFLGFTTLTMPSIAGAASKSLAGSKELPTVMKSFMGLGEAALEAAFSGCPKYLGGGIVVLIFLAILFLGIAYATLPGGPVYRNTQYTRTGPQPLPTPLDQAVSLPDKTEHAVLELLPGQTWELVKRPRGEQVTGSSFGAGVPMQGVTDHRTTVPSVMMSADLAYDVGLERRDTPPPVEMVTITIGGAAMGCCSGSPPAEEGQFIEDVVKKELNAPEDSAPDERSALYKEKTSLEKQIYDLGKKIDDLQKQLDPERKKKPATYPKTLSQDQQDQLDPTVKKGKWTPQEDALLIEALSRLENKWAEIAKLLPGRTDNAIKNRWLEIDLKPKLFEVETRLRNFPDAQVSFLTKQIEEKQREIEAKKGAGQDTSIQTREKLVLEQRKKDLIDSAANGYGLLELAGMKLLLTQIDEEKGNLGWSKDNPIAIEQGVSATIDLLREELQTMHDAKDLPGWIKVLMYIPMLPSVVKQFIINEILFIATKNAKEKDPSAARGENFAGPMSQFPNFGGYLPKNDPAAQAFVGRCGALFEEQTAEKVYYQIWNYLMLGLQAIFIKTITTPSYNAAANLGLKVADFVLKFILAPHSSKSAYFDDILAQALNVLQVGVLYKFVKDKAEGLAKGQGLGGNSAGTFFVGGALAAIGPLLFTAMYECFLKLLALRRKMRLAHAKMQDGVKAMNAVKERAANKDAETDESKRLLTRALKKAMTTATTNVNPESGAAPNSVAGVELTEAEIERYAEIVAELLTTNKYDGKVIFKAANEIKVQYLKSSNTAERGQGGSSSDETITNITCLLTALKTVMNNPSYKDALDKGGKNLLFQLLILPKDLDLNQDLNAVASGLNSNVIENIARFRKVMQLCSDFDPEKAKKYYRKAKLVLYDLPSPEEYTQEALKDYVMGITDKQEEDQAKVQAKVQTSREQQSELELLARARKGMKIRIRIRRENKDPEYFNVDPGDKIKISRATVRYGTDFSEMYPGQYVAKPLGALPHTVVEQDGDTVRYLEHVKQYRSSKELAKEVYYNMTEAVVNNPFNRAHVDRTVVVEWEEEGIAAKGKIDTGARGPQVMSVPPWVMAVPPSAMPPYNQFADYRGQQPGYPVQQPGYPGQR